MVYLLSVLDMVIAKYGYHNHNQLPQYKESCLLWLTHVPLVFTVTTAFLAIEYIMISRSILLSAFCNKKKFIFHFSIILFNSTRKL